VSLIFLINWSKFSTFETEFGQVGHLTCSRRYDDLVFGQLRACRSLPPTNWIKWK